MSPKLIMAIAVAMASRWLFATESFTVTQYNSIDYLRSVSEAEYAIDNPSAWLSNPVTGYYGTVAFAYNLNGTYPNFRGRMSAIPGNVLGVGAFALVVTGYISIPSIGNWTFACGSDDGFAATISGHGRAKTFSHPSTRMFATSLETFSFPEAGIYRLEIIYFNKGIGASPSDNQGALEFSFAQGSYSSFNSSAFHLVEAAEGYTLSFNANDGSGTMEPRSCGVTELLQLPANQFIRDGYHFIGWALTPDGEVVYQDGEEIPVDSDKTLYAVWARDAQDLVVLLHGNGGVTTDGATEANVSFYFNDAKVLPSRPFTRGRSRLLGWSVGTANYDWSVGRGLSELISDGASLTITRDNLLYCAEHDGAEVLQGIPTLHLYAIWETEVTTTFFNSGEPSSNASLAPPDLANHLRFRFDYEVAGVLHSTGETVKLPPGKHRITWQVDSGYELYASSWQLLVGPWTCGTAPDFVIGSAYSAAIPSGTTAALSLFVRVAAAEEKSGFVMFQCADAMTAEQKAAWPDFPAFDASKVKITLTPSREGVAGLVMRLGEWEELPVGDYFWSAEYADTVGSMKIPYWEATGSRAVTVEEGKSLPREIGFLPFGREYAHSFAKLSFDGNGGNVPFDEMWFVVGQQSLSQFSVDTFSENRIPVSTRAGVWPSCEWRCDTADEQQKISIDSLQTLRSFVMRWLSNDPPVRRFAFVADWEKPEAWLRENASKAMAANSGNYEAAAAMPAANGSRTIGECYALGIDPEDPNDDLRITQFKMTDGKPELTLNHTEDGSGNSFVSRTRILGAKTLDITTQWDDVTDIANPEAAGCRFFKVEVDPP